MKCPKCQFENREEALFCSECGHRFEVACPKCGGSIRVGSKFCDLCGHDLSTREKSSIIDYKQPESYTPKFLADKILTTRTSIEGERKVVTVLFADVANYTSIAAKLDPEEVHQMMDGCFKVLMDEIHRYEGTINQFTGDGVMALFGAPVAHEDHPQRACRAAISIQKAIAIYENKTKKEWATEFKMRIGLNSGPVVVGSIGDDLRMDYTAVGDTTNLASRMESMARPGSILVSESTYRMARGFFEFISMGRLEVKGKEKPQEAFELRKVGEIETRIDAALSNGLTKFVGRDRQIEALQESFEKAKAGSGQVIGIVGEAGVGKSRILLELQKSLPPEEVTFLQGRCVHFGESMSYLPILDILKSYFGIKEGDQEVAIKKKMKEKILGLDEKLKPTISPLQQLLSITVDDKKYYQLEPKQKRERTFEAIRDLLFVESQNRPMVVAIEDLHWIDRATEELLTYLIDWLANMHIMLILLYRPEYRHQWGSKSYYSKIGLDQLSTESSAELVQAILEGGKVVPELRELILNRASGNPLFMEEFTHTLLENGSIQKKDHQYVLSRKITDIEVPDTIQAIIAARMDRLEDNLKRTMQVASVIGRDFAFRILQTITGMSEELKSHLLNLQGLEFIYEKRLFPELEYIFKHALTQEVAYHSLLLKRRREIHEQIGKAIEQIYPERLEEFYEMLAYHYSKSGNRKKTYQYLKLSGDKASRNYSNWEAFRFYKEAFEALKNEPENEQNLKEKLAILHSHSATMMILNYPEDSLQFLQEGERIAKDSRDRRSLAVFYSLIGKYFSLKEGNPLLGVKYSERCFREAQKINDIELTAKTAWDLCTSYSISGQQLKVTDIAQKIVGSLEKTRRKHESFGTGFNLYSGLLTFWATSLGWTGKFGEGKKLFEKALRFASEVDDKTSLAWTEFSYGNLYNNKGEGQNAINHIQKAIEIMEEIKYELLLGLAWGCLGSGYHLIGDLKAAEKLIKKGLEIQKKSGLPIFLSWHFISLSEVYFDLGDFSNAKKHIDQALRLSQKTNEKVREGRSKIMLGRILGKSDTSKNSEGEKHILQGMKILDTLKIRPMLAQGYLFLGEIYAEAGQKEKTLKNLNRAQGMFQEMGMDYWLIKTQEVFDRL